MLAKWNNLDTVNEDHTFSVLNELRSEMARVIALLKDGMLQLTLSNSEDAKPKKVFVEEN